MTDFDVIVIGGGLLGCFAARNLMRYRRACALFEAESDVCTGISKANTAVVYGSQDNMPGTLKANLCKRACDGFPELCDDLGVEFKRCGSLMVCFGDGGLKKLTRCLSRGIENGVGGLRIIERDEILSLEPALNPEVYRALYAENTGTTDTWRLCVSAAENAARNGAVFRMGTAVREILREKGFYRLLCDDGEYTARCVINCAGINADRLNFTLGVNDIGIVPTRADYIVTDDSQGSLISRVIFYETEKKGKGLTIVPTTEGNLLIGPSELPVEGNPDTETRADGINFVRECASLVLPGIDLSRTIRTFAGLRPNPFKREKLPDGSFGLSDESIKDFAVVIMPEGLPGYLSFAGIKTPGMTCADMLGRLAAEKCAEYLAAEENPGFDPKNPRKEKAGGDIVCRCKKVTEGEIVRAVRTSPGAVTVDGVKRRTGCGLGVCQGSRCTEKIARIIAREKGISPEKVLKGEKGSWIMRKNTTS